MKPTILIIVAIAILTIGIMFVCISINKEEITCVPSDQVHEWGMWSNSWSQCNDFGRMRQERYCTKCGKFQSGLDK